MAAASVPFIKAAACGNDFLIIACMHATADLGEFTRLFNADGTEAELSGNGTRCVAACLVEERGCDAVLVRTGAGLKRCRLTSRQGMRFEFEMAMGEPQLGDKFSIKLAFREAKGIPVSVGNPHFVVFVEDFLPGWQAEAAEIGRHHDFVHGTNVELVRPRDPHAIEVRIFERGVGETQSSGTGSCAAAVAAIAAGKALSPVEVHAPGGAQAVRWEGEVFLRGPADILCRGEFFG
jgi:diaminopimelate epimerase